MNPALFQADQNLFGIALAAVLLAFVIAIVLGVIAGAHAVGMDIWEAHMKRKVTRERAEALRNNPLHPDIVEPRYRIIPRRPPDFR